MTVLHMPESECHVKDYTLNYLKQHGIYHEVYFSKELEADTVIMVFENCELCPKEVVEGSIFFFEKERVMECRTYYNETGRQGCAGADEKNRTQLKSLLNFINAEVFPRTPNDGAGGKLYKPSYLYAPRFYMTEDGNYDITMNTLVPYDFFELAPVETLDFLTVTCPGLLNELSPVIFNVLLGRSTADGAKCFLRGGEV